MPDKRIIFGLTALAVLFNIGTVLVGVFTVRPVLALQGVLNTVISAACVYSGYLVGRGRSDIWKKVRPWKKKKTK